MDLTPEEIKMLAQQQRQMDAGLIPYVVYRGDRLALLPQVMEEFGFETGQTIDTFLFKKALDASLACFYTMALLGEIEGKQNG